MEKLIRSQDWIKVARIIGDKHKIHRKEINAKNRGFKGKVALGVYVASCFAPEEFKELNVNFVRPIYNNSLVHSEDSGESRILKFENKEVLNMNYSLITSAENKIDMNVPSDSFIYKTLIRQQGIDGFSNLTGASNYFPSSYLFSLCAPALTKYGKVKKVHKGLHTNQSIKIFDNYALGNLEIAIQQTGCEEKKRFYTNKADFYWIQNDKVIATGRSEVAIFK